MEARPPVLPRHRPGPALQGDRPRDRVPRHDARRARDHRRARRCARRSSRSRRAASHVANTNRYRHPLGEGRARVHARVRPTRSRSAILFEGPETVAAVFLEPVQNAGGCFVAARGLLPARPRDLRPLRRAARVRRGHLRVRPARRRCSARERYDYLPDMITTRQGPHERLLAARRGDLSRLPRRAVPRGRPRVFPHGITFGGHPVSCAVALANLDCSRRRTCSSNVRGATRPASASGSKALRDIPIVGDVRGAGYFLGDRARGGPGDRASASPGRGARTCCAASSSPAAATRPASICRDRRPRRSGRPARAAADRGRRRVRRDRDASLRTVLTRGVGAGSSHVTASRTAPRGVTR